MFRPVEVTSTAIGQGTITHLTDRAQVALTGFRVDAKPGDWMIENAGTVVVVSADGRIADLGSKGGSDALDLLNPTIYLGFDLVHWEIDHIQPSGEGGRVLHVVRRGLEKPVFLHEIVWLEGDLLHIETAVTAASPAAAAVIATLGEGIDWGNVPTWAEGHGHINATSSFFTDFVARDDFNVAYALCSVDGPLHARFRTGGSGFWEGASLGEYPQSVPLDGPSARRHIVVSHAEGSMGKAALALPCRQRPGADVLRMPAGLPTEARLEVARCGPEHQPFARFSPGDSGLALPQGCFEGRLLAPGHAPSAWFPVAEAANHTLVPSGTFKFAVTDKKGGGPLPARVIVESVDGVDPDWGLNGNDGAALNVIHSETGRGERPIPPGKYQVTIGRGFEYSAVKREITITAGQTELVTAELSRVVDTKGFITADLHLHAIPSPDAPTPLADRVRALVATGVEVGVATDHNVVTDYAPVIEQLGVGKYVASVIGDEVTTRDPYFGHFNVFPLAAGSPPAPFKGQTPKSLISSGRAATIDGLVQVNHPLMGGIGYLSMLRFNRDDVSGWERRVPLADLGFEAIEIFNGDHYNHLAEVDECLKAWFALLNAGHRFTATGNSDSHRLTFHEAGVPRNLVAMANDDPAKFDQHDFVKAIREGRVIVSSGPFVQMKAGGRGIGETAMAGDVPITITVDAPAWVDVDRVELIKNGEVLQTWRYEVPPPPPIKPGKNPAPAKPPKPAPPPEPPRPIAPFQEGPRVFSLEGTLAMKKGDWIVAIARGSKPMSYLYRSGSRPLGFTNPIWFQ